MDVEPVAAPPTREQQIAAFGENVRIEDKITRIFERNTLGRDPNKQQELVQRLIDESANYKADRASYLSDMKKIRTLINQTYTNPDTQLASLDNILKNGNRYRAQLRDAYPDSFNSNNLPNVPENAVEEMRAAPMPRIPSLPGFLNVSYPPIGPPPLEEIANKFIDRSRPDLNNRNYPLQHRNKYIQALENDVSLYNDNPDRYFQNLVAIRDFLEHTNPLHYFLFEKGLYEDNVVRERLGIELLPTKNPRSARLAGMQAALSSDTSLVGKTDPITGEKIVIPFKLQADGIVYDIRTLLKLEQPISPYTRQPLTSEELIRLGKAMHEVARGGGKRKSIKGKKSRKSRKGSKYRKSRKSRKLRR
jgi:hypothetical protein